MCSNSVNVAPGTPKPGKSKHESWCTLYVQVFRLLLGSKWVALVGKELRRALQDVLINLLKQFLNCDLQMQESAEVAIHDIEAKLDPVAMFEELQKCKS